MTEPVDKTEVPTSDQKPEDVGPRTQAPGVVPTASTSVDEGGEAIAEQRDAAVEQAKPAEGASEAQQAPTEPETVEDDAPAPEAPRKARKPV